MRKRVYSKPFRKKIRQLKGQLHINAESKIIEICSQSDINHYKNLCGNLKKYKRVHVNKSFIILFFANDNTVYFVDYVHHDAAYNDDKKLLKKYKELFEKQY